ncbi:MAG: response regulator [Sandaracinaceae bacterium]|nr:response regulator [Sandaracinaceae bacterium]
MKVLLVEDSPTQAAQLELVLADCGLDDVRVASRLDEALGLLAEAASDVVLLDLELPDATGLTGCARVTSQFPGVPLVVLTSHAGDETAVAAIEQGAEDYILKHQVDPSGLKRSLRYAIERHRSRNALAALTEQLRAKTSELEAINQQKDLILGVVAHDLRNPLGVVRGYADFLASGAIGEPSAEQAEILAIVRRTADYMLRLVEDLLDFSRIQSGRMELDRAETDLVELVSEAVRVHQVLAQPKEIAVELARADDVGKLFVDGHKIRQVLDNLLSNALKFSHKGGRVEVLLERNSHCAHVAVRDHGVGMSAQDVGRIFRPFEKGSSRPTGGERSTGLGLAIVRNIVEAHGGRIVVESAPGEGSTFDVELPLEPRPKA